MPPEPIQALQAIARPGPGERPRPRLVIAGATGALGNELLRRLVGLQHFSATQVLAREPIRAGLRGVGVTVVPAEDPQAWPPGGADTGLILFDPPRLFYDRERALWTPTPQQLPMVARWMRASGVRTLAVVLPHAQGRLPESLKRGLASLDEHAVATLGFERLLIVRSAEKPAPPVHANVLAATAHWMLSIFKYMVPSSEQPVRAAKVAELVALALQIAPPGTHIAPPEVVWRAAQGADMRPVVRQWLGV